MITLATASPRTNRLAPSMLAKKSACRWRAIRISRACSRLIVPACTSVSIAICRPGRPSRANRATTSLVRVEPAVITTNWMTAMIAKITAPTTISLAATNSPNACTTPPAAALPSTAARVRISRVVAILSTSRTSVAPSRNVGKMLISSGVRAANAPNSASTASVRLAASITSTTAAGTGAITTSTASSMAAGITKSSRWAESPRGPATDVPADCAMMEGMRLAKIGTPTTAPPPRKVAGGVTQEAGR